VTAFARALQCGQPVLVRGLLLPCEEVSDISFRVGRQRHLTFAYQACMLRTPGDDTGVFLPFAPAAVALGHGTSSPTDGILLITHSGHGPFHKSLAPGDQTSPMLLQAPT
jgi:hypothetical protein